MPQIIKDSGVRPHQLLRGNPTVGGAGGGQQNGLHSRLRHAVFSVQGPGLGARGEHRLDGGVIQDNAHVIRLGIADAGIVRSPYLAAGQHVPGV